MKKVIFMAAIAAMALVACSNDNEVATNNATQGEEISFRTLTQKTRVTETTTQNITDFKVSGFWSETTPVSPNFMYGINVVRKGSAWEYSPLRYWPTDGEVTFYAYSPAGSISATNFAADATTPTISYAVSNNNAMQEDFLVASTAAMTTGTVQLTFKHALSQVVVEANSTVQDVTFTISSVELTTLKSEATLDLSATTLAWTAAATPLLTYSAPLLPLTIVYTSDPTAFQSVTGPNDGLMVLPQVFTTGTNADLHDNANTTDLTPDGIPDDVDANVYLAVTYSSVAAPNTPLETNKKVYFPLDLSNYGTNVGTNEFEMGMKYKFQLTLSGGLTPIVFDVAAVDAWKDPIEVPIP